MHGLDPETEFRKMLEEAASFRPSSPAWDYDDENYDYDV